MRSAALRVLLVTASAGFAVAAWYVAARARGDRGPTPRPPEHDERADVPGFAGECELAGGARLVVRVAELHATPSRQEFDAGALRERYGLDEGHPYACEIRCLAPEGVRVPAVDLAALAVEDALGTAQRPLAPPPSGLDLDPLATLLGPPREPLGRNECVSLVLWGRAPGADARLVGFDGARVSLARAALPRRDLETALARIGAPRRTPNAGAGR